MWKLLWLTFSIVNPTAETYYSFRFFLTRETACWQLYNTAYIRLQNYDWETCLHYLSKKKNNDWETCLYIYSLKYYLPKNIYFFEV